MKHLFYMLALLFVVNVSFAQNVEIQGQLKLVNGTHGDGKVLVSDDDGVSKWISPTELLIRQFEHRKDGVKRLISWGISAVELWEEGVPYDSIIGLNINLSTQTQYDEYIFYVDTLDIYPFEYLTSVTPIFTYARWACPTTEINGADGQLLGNGHQNTIDVLNQCPNPPDGQSIFTQYINTNSGIPNIHIASNEEATRIYNVVVASGINPSYFNHNNVYWTSTEAEAPNAATRAKAINMQNNTGTISEIPKTTETRAIIVRRY